MEYLDWRLIEEVGDEERERLCRGTSWQAILMKLGRTFRVTSGGKIMTLCVFRHDEKTPSLRLWPGGGYCCHGCRRRGGSFVAFVSEALDLRYWCEVELFFLGCVAPAPATCQLELPFP